MIANSITVEYLPGYGQFYVQDPRKFDMMASANITQGDIKKGYLVGDGIIILFCKHEDQTVCIELSVDKNKPVVTEKSWIEVVECNLKINSDQVVLASCPDGPEYGTFGKIIIQNKIYAAGVWKYEDERSEHFKIALWDK